MAKFASDLARLPEDCFLKVCSFLAIDDLVSLQVSLTTHYQLASGEVLNHADIAMKRIMHLTIDIKATKRDRPEDIKRMLLKCGLCLRSFSVENAKRVLLNRVFTNVEFARQFASRSPNIEQFDKQLWIGNLNFVQNYCEHLQYKCNLTEVVLCLHSSLHILIEEQLLDFLLRLQSNCERIAKIKILVFNSMSHNKKLIRFEKDQLSKLLSLPSKVQFMWSSGLLQYWDEGISNTPYDAVFKLIDVAKIEMVAPHWFPHETQRFLNENRVKIGVDAKKPCIEFDMAGFTDCEIAKAMREGVDQERLSE